MVNIMNAQVHIDEFVNCVYMVNFDLKDKHLTLKYGTLESMMEACFKLEKLKLVLGTIPNDFVGQINMLKYGHLHDLNLDMNYHT